MTKLGFLLLVVGLTGFVLSLTGAVESWMPFLTQLPLAGWCGVSGAGIVLLILNRRPAD